MKHVSNFILYDKFACGFRSLCERGAEMHHDMIAFVFIFTTTSVTCFNGGIIEIENISTHFIF